MSISHYMHTYTLTDIHKYIYTHILCIYTLYTHNLHKHTIPANILIPANIPENFNTLLCSAT